jgi:pilus assembly protein CpaB
MTYRLRNIGIAVVLAIVAALLTTFYVTNYKRNVQQGEEKVAVYVASHDIPLGTSGSDVASGGMLRVDHVPRRSVVPGAISQPNQVDKLVAVQPIYAGEQVSTRRFATAKEQGIRAQLKGNLRAVQVAGSEPQLLVGTLKEGDRVDMIGTWTLPESSQNHVSRVVLRNLPVLQAPDTSRFSSKIGSSPDQPFSAMLAMTDSQAQKFWWVAQNGEWTLDLRPVTDAADSPERLENAVTTALDGVSARERKRVTGGR